MSSKRKQLKTTKKTKKSSIDDSKRDSFSQRIGDDLSEVILQYLSLKDKLRLECVFKQFQRTIFERQYSLDIKEFQNKRFNFKAFKCVLKKKCLNVSNISEVVPNGLRLITKKGQMDPQKDKPIVSSFKTNTN